jgi:hypothetical protein
VSHAAHFQVNSIHPGYYRTALTEQYITDPAYKDVNDYVLSRTPAGRWGDPKDLKGAMIFLASAASDYVTGVSSVSEHENILIGCAVQYCGRRRLHGKIRQRDLHRDVNLPWKMSLIFLSSLDRMSW